MVSSLGAVQGLLQLEVEMGRGLSHKLSLSVFFRVLSSLGMITALGILDTIQSWPPVVKGAATLQVPELAIRPRQSKEFTSPEDTSPGDVVSRDSSNGGC